MLRDATGDLQEGDELEGDPGLPARSPHLREGQRPDIKVEKQIASGGRAEAAASALASGTAPMPRTGSELPTWRRSGVISSLSRWTGSTSGKPEGCAPTGRGGRSANGRVFVSAFQTGECGRERPAAISIEIKSIDDTSNFDDFPESDILQPGLSQGGSGAAMLCGELVPSLLVFSHLPE